MKVKNTLKELVTNYEDKDGQNPIMAAFNLVTFVKSIPIEIIKAIVLSVVIYLGMNGLFYYFSASFLILLASIIGGLLFIVFSSFTGSLKNITDAFMDNVSDLVLGTLQPIDSLYEKWKESNDENLTKKEFMVKVLKEVMVPGIIDQIGRIPFSGRLQKKLNGFVDNFSKEEEGGDKTESNDSSLQKTMNRITKAVEFSKRGINKPFMLTLKIGGFFWGVLWLFHLIGML